MKIIISENGKEKKIVMAVSVALKFVFEKGKLCGDDKKKRRKLIKEIGACLKEYKKENGSFVLLEAEENQKSLVKIVI